MSTYLLKFTQYRVPALDITPEARFYINVGSTFAMWVIAFVAPIIITFA